MFKNFPEPHTPTSMKRYIFTGTPGSGKTSLLRELQLHGYTIIEEAATDVIAIEHSRGTTEPWLHADFIDKITLMQQQRQLEAIGSIQLYDRSPICTLALSRYLGYPPPDILLEELDRIKRENIYERQIFFLDNLGFVEPTAARRISYENALIFENLHKEVYRELNYELIMIPPEPIAARTLRIMEWM